MGAVGSVLGAVGGAVGGVTDLFGGGGGDSSSSDFQNKQTSTRTLGSQTEIDALSDAVGRSQLSGLNKDLNNLSPDFAQDYRAIANQFRNALTKFATGSLQPSPEQLAQATSFVDQTFTAPAQQQFSQFLDQANTLTAQRAAAQGRSSLDSAINQQFVSEAGRVAQDLANQRGSLIAQRADELSYNRPMQQVSMLGQGTQFFNQPLQNAMNNRLSLLNAATGQQGLGFQRQLATGTATSEQSGTGAQSQSGASMGSMIGNAASGLGTGLSAAGRFFGF